MIENNFIVKDSNKKYLLVGIIVVVLYFFIYGMNNFFIYDNYVEIFFRCEWNVIYM